VRRALASLLLLACSAAPSRAADPHPIRIALIPDPQNYCSTDRLDAKGFQIHDEKIALEQLDAQIDDVIAQRPDFALVLGDLTDTTGGPDQNRAGGNRDDASSAGLPRDAEWSCYVEHVPKRLEAAKIPYLEVTGNHDSCVDYERWRPRAEFLKRPWAYAAEALAGGCGKDLPNTEQRAALFPTPATPICVIGVDYNSNTGTAEREFVAANLGCGGDHPTIILRHSNAAQGRWMDDAANDAIFMTVEGHFVGRLPFTTMSDPGPRTARGGFQYVYAMINMQEVSEGGRGTPCAKAAQAPRGSCMHTGLSWWALATIAPATSAIAIEPRAPWLGGRSTSHLPALYPVPGPRAVTLSPSWCERFPRTKGC
jgi:hypothetical protein